jgi:hypothetical protein
MVTELRAVAADLAARAVFAADGESVRGTRSLLLEMLDPPVATGMLVNLIDHSPDPLTGGRREARIQQELDDMIEIG